MFVISKIYVYLRNKFITLKKGPIIKIRINIIYRFYCSLYNLKFLLLIRGC